MLVHMLRGRAVRVPDRERALYRVVTVMPMQQARAR